MLHDQIHSAYKPQSLPRIIIPRTGVHSLLTAEFYGIAKQIRIDTLGYTIPVSNESLRTTGRRPA
jgi:hypothetical protein